MEVHTRCFPFTRTTGHAPRPTCPSNLPSGLPVLVNSILHAAFHLPSHTRRARALLPGLLTIGKSVCDAESALLG